MLETVEVTTSGYPACLGGGCGRTGRGRGGMWWCCCCSVSDKGSWWVAGGVMFFIRSSAQYILPTPVGAKGRADTWQHPASFYLTPELKLTHKNIVDLTVFACTCMRGRGQATYR